MEQKIIKVITDAKEKTVIAIDGRCASGKTTLAEKIKIQTGCEVVHMDDFFLPREKRTNDIGGNIDFERLIKDVLVPFKKGEKVFYEPFLCKKGKMGDRICIENITVLILEGAYSTHKKLDGLYDFSFFLDIEKEEQLKRIKQRNGHNFEDFINIWIPREEEYFKAKENG